MRNNGNTFVTDCGGYRSAFDVILSPMVKSLASHNRHGVYFKGRALEQKCQWQGAPVMWWSSRWQLEFGFKVKLV
jgi:hypothetical protein